jgi:hypothetical protein
MIAFVGLRILELSGRWVRCRCDTPLVLGLEMVPPILIHSNALLIQAELVKRVAKAGNSKR